MPEPGLRRRAALSKTVQAAIFRRDCWLCRWCARPVVFVPAMRLLELDLLENGCHSPVAYYDLHWTRAMAPLLDELGAVLDHVDAFSTGGECNQKNLVTACAKCNGRKSAAPLEDWSKRVIRKPIQGKYGEPAAWDGLSSVFLSLGRRYSGKLTPSERQWLTALD